jgi:hypothetical protein
MKELNETHEQESEVHNHKVKLEIGGWNGGILVFHSDGEVNDIQNGLKVVNKVCPVFEIYLRSERSELGQFYTQEKDDQSA